MTIANVMTKQVLVVERTTTVRNAAFLLFHNGLSGVPVVDPDNRLVGMISEKDIFRALFPSAEELHATQSLVEFLNTKDVEARAREIGQWPVERFMRTNVITCEPMDSVIRVGALMLAHGIHRLPVVENDQIVGIVDRQDIFHRILEREFLVNEHQMKGKQKKTKVSSQMK